MFDLTTQTYIIKFVAKDFKFIDPASHTFNRSVVRKVNFEFSIDDPVYPIGADARMWATLFDTGKWVIRVSIMKCQFT